MRLDNYIRPGDELQIVPRSVALPAFRGTVLEVGTGEVGTRELLVVRQGETLLEGAVGVLEDRAMLSVRRGAEWVLVPLPISLAEAEKKSVRNFANQVKRAQQHAPLFADQIVSKAIDPVEWVARDRAQGEEDLERSHAQALESTHLRDEVEALVSPEDFASLTERRERWGTGASFGTYFWNKQLDHIRIHGCPETFQAPPPLNKSLDLPGLQYGKILTWSAAPGGPKQVRVLWVGSMDILCHMEGLPITDYDPKLIPTPTVWLSPTEVGYQAPSQLGNTTPEGLPNEQCTSTSCTD
jgi:hypothetical protein